MSSLDRFCRKMEMNGMSSTVPRGKANPLYESKESLDTPWYRPQSTPRLVKAKGANRGPAVFVVLALISDFLVLLFVVIFEYFLRCSSTWYHRHTDVQSVCRDLWTSKFTFRRRSFTCKDPALSANSTAVSDFDNFPFKADVRPEITFGLSFGVPILLIFFCEIVLWALMPRQAKDVGLSICPNVTVPHVVRRIYRFTITFIFGGFALMLLVDMVKLFVGQLRPNFLSICRPVCDEKASNVLLTIDNCQEQDKLILKEASTSFPSMQAAISMYAAITIAVYLHGITRIHHSKFICVPFVGLGVLSLALCCGLARFGRNHSWWIDVVVGQLAGALMALYLGILVLRGYDFQEAVSNRKLNRQLNHVTSLERNREAREDSVPMCDVGITASLGAPPQCRPPVSRCPYSDVLPRVRLSSGPGQSAEFRRAERVRRTGSEFLCRY